MPYVYIMIYQIIIYIILNNKKYYIMINYLTDHRQELTARREYKFVDWSGTDGTSAG